MKDDFMLDLETLGRRAGCAILSIGAVTFDESEIGEETFYVVVNTQSCIDAGLHVDQETVDWWSKQNDAARSVIAEAEASPVTLDAALERFTAFLHSVSSKGKARVWGNGADFDNAIITACYAAVGRELPWEFWNNRCYRTLKGLRKDIEAGERFGAYHNALDDAISQANHASKLLEALK